MFCLRLTNRKHICLGIVTCGFYFVYLKLFWLICDQQTRVLSLLATKPREILPSVSLLLVCILFAWLSFSFWWILSLTIVFISFICFCFDHYEPILHLVLLQISTDKACCPCCDWKHMYSNCFYCKFLLFCFIILYTLNYSFVLTYDMNDITIPFINSLNRYC